MAGIKIDIKANTKDFAKQIKEFKNETRKLNEEQKRANQNAKNLASSQLLLAQSTKKTELSARRLTLQENKLTLQEKKLAQQTKNTSIQFKALDGSYNSLVRRNKELLAKMKATEGGMNSKTTAMKKMKAEYLANNNRLKAFDVSLGNSQRNVGNYGSALMGLTSASIPLKIALTALAGAVAVITPAYIYATLKGGEFQQSMANLKAITQPTAKEFNALSQEARRLGETTAFSASQAGGAFVELGKLGFSSAQIIESSAEIMNLASGANVTLAESAKATATTLKQFQLDTSETARVTDIMAKSFTISALDMEKYSEAMKFAGAIANKTNVSFKDTTSAIATLAEQNITGSIAGTALRRIFSELGDETSKVSNLLMSKGVPATASFSEKMAVLAEQGLTVGENIELFGRNAATASTILVDSASTTRKFGEQLQWTDGKAKGFADSMAKTQLDTLEGDMKLLASATEGFGIALFDSFKDSQRKGVQLLTESMGDLSAWIKENDTKITAFGENALKAFNLMVTAGGNALKVMEKIGDFLGVTEAGLFSDTDTQLKQINREIRDTQKLVDESLIKREGSNVKKYKDIIKELKDEKNEIIKLSGLDLALDNFTDKEIIKMGEFSQATLDLARSTEVLAKSNEKLEKTKPKLNRDRSVEAILGASSPKTSSPKTSSPISTPASTKGEIAIGGFLGGNFEKMFENLEKQTEAIKQAEIKKQDAIRSIRQEALSQTLEGEKKLLQEDRDAKAELVAGDAESMILLGQNTARKRLEIEKKYQEMKYQSQKKYQEMERRQILSTLNTTKQAMQAGFNVAQLFAGKNKTLAISEALVNGALGITKTFATYGATPPGFAGSALIASNTALQVAEISKQSFADGGLSGGRVNGRGTARGDKIATSLSAGEFVVNQGVASQNMPMLNALNSGSTSNSFSFSPVINITSSEGTEGSITTIINNQRDEFVEVMKDLQSRGEFA